MFLYSSFHLTPKCIIYLVGMGEVWSFCVIDTVTCSHTLLCYTFIIWTTLKWALTVHLHCMHYIGICLCYCLVHRFLYCRNFNWYIYIYIYSSLYIRICYWQWHVTCDHNDGWIAVHDLCIHFFFFWRTKNTRVLSEACIHAKWPIMERFKQVRLLKIRYTKNVRGCP